MHQATDEQGFSIETSDLRSMLGHVQCIRQACDLDLLLFFHRHPCALLSGEQAFAQLGYGFRQAAASLDGLVDAGVLMRSRGRSGKCCLYALQTSGLQDDPLLSLLRIAATPEGRKRVKRLLRSGPEGTEAAELPYPAARARAVSDHAVPDHELAA